MSTSSTVSIPLMPMGESCKRAVIFNVEFKKGQVMSQVFMSMEIIEGLVFEHTNEDPVVVRACV